MKLPPDLGPLHTFLGSPVISGRSGPLFIRERSQEKLTKRQEAARVGRGLGVGVRWRSVGAFSALQGVPARRAPAGSGPGANSFP